MKDSNAKYWVYVMFPFIPIAPAASILLQLTTRKIDGVVVAIARVDFINTYVAWAMLIL